MLRIFSIRALRMATRLGRRSAPALLLALSGLTALSALSARAAEPQPHTHLRIVGGLAGMHQFTRHEEPFWSRELVRLSGGRASAEIVPFDRAGLRGQEMLRLVSLGAVPFGTALLSLSAAHDPVLFAPDLAGLNPDLASMQRSAAAFRPTLERMLRERHAVELLALYVDPAQDTFCTRPLAGIADLAGRRVRVGTGSQADFVLALGGVPVQTAFGEIGAGFRNASIDCAITGTMSGNRCGPDCASVWAQTLAPVTGIVLH